MSDTNEQRPPPIRTPIETQEENTNQGGQVPEPEVHESQIPTFQIPADWGVKALVALNYTTSFLSYVGSFLWKVGRGVWKSFQPEMYVFFEGSSFPYNKNDLNLDAPGVPRIAWYYDAANHILVSGHLYNTSDTIRVHHLPFLSAELKYNDLVLHDITEFMENIRWGGDANQEPPSAKILLAIWSLKTGIVLQDSESLKLIVINEEGNEQTIPIQGAAVRT